MRISTAAKKTSLFALRLTSETVKLTAKASYSAVAFTSRTIYNNRKEIAGVTVGTAKGTANIVKGISGNVVTKNRIQKYLDTLDIQASRYQRIKLRFEDQLQRGLSNKNLLLDTLVVGGHSLSSYANKANVPEQIQEAYEKAYPDVAAEYSFSDQLDRLDGNRLVGFASGIKGKLFEQQYVDYLNNFELDGGYHAELAQSPTNIGWDIAIFGPDGNLDKVLQAKATASSSYVLEALEKNPFIDVVSTSEVNSSLALHGISSVIDSGISDASLQEAIETAFESADLTMSWMPSVIALSIIAVSASRQKDLSAYGKTKQFGERAVKSYFAYIVGGAAAVATNTWWMAIVGGIGSRLLVGSGNSQFERAKRLRELIAKNEVLLDKLERQYAFG